MLRTGSPRTVKIHERNQPQHIRHRPHRICKFRGVRTGGKRGVTGAGLLVQHRERARNIHIVIERIRKVLWYATILRIRVHKLQGSGKKRLHTLDSNPCLF